MVKYIVKTVGVTSRIEFAFERTFDVYEKNDQLFVKKLLSILKFKNRNSGRIATSDYHQELISHITKVAVIGDSGYEDISEERINTTSELINISQYYKRKLNQFWDDGAPHNYISAYDEIPDGNNFTRQNRIEGIESNLMVH